MASERLYYDDSYTTHFTASTARHGEHQGRPAVELQSTYFYPESGGQLADRGILGGSRVVDVQADDEGRVWHVVDAEPSGDALAAEVDWTRRFDSMQQHTGQHILSAAFERAARAATISSHLGEERSSIEVELGEIGWPRVGEIEAAANRIVWEDRPIERHWVEERDLARFSLRKPPPAERRGSGGRIRIVEIPDWDVSACGGTHTRRTGEVGVIKVLRWEKVRGNLRFDFVCGARALEDHAWRTEALVEGAKRRTLKDRELLAHLEKAAAERDELRKRLDELSERLLLTEARDRVGDPARPVTDFAERRTREEARRFAIKCLEAGAPWVAIAAGSPEPVVVIGRAKTLALDLKTMVPDLLERTGGKGGGSPDLVQASAADAQRAEAAWRWAVEKIGSSL
ncbi:MAG TPA: alanyl-tRNA editing protein [Candidatus Eisenbacteria bacterium]|nr:alanyl-tRNA editing protein [Candidatus Eisenbacteria bacterium]